MLDTKRITSSSIDYFNVREFSVITKLIIIFTAIYIVVISTVNIVAYAKILQEPENERPVNNAWSITLIVMNVLLMLAGLFIIVIMIISFFRNSAKTKDVKIGIKEVINNTVDEVSDKSTKILTNIGLMYGLDYSTISSIAMTLEAELKNMTS